MDEMVKQVKVDNWGTFFLQRLKHFFNRTDYCDLTLQFQDKAQLKVHRLVLSACTEYFELLERTCEMYEDCLVMPDDLQADVVVPIINFMYTGQLEFSMDILEKLYQTSLVMNLPVLTSLLESHRSSVTNIKPPFMRHFNKNYKSRTSVSASINVQPHNTQANKRPYKVAFENCRADPVTNKVVIPSTHNPLPRIRNKVKPLVSKEPIPKIVPNNKESISKTLSINKYGMSPYYNKKLIRGEPKPTRCELPEELENEDNVFSNSFMNISYESKPIVVHPETSKAQAKVNSIFKKSSMDLECKKVTRTCSLFDDNPDVADDYDIPQASITHNAPRQSAAQMFDQIVDNQENNFNKPKVTIETSDCKQSANLDHAKIISEVLKKYPHLVNSNKNIKLKVLNTNNKSTFSPKKSNTMPKNLTGLTFTQNSSSGVDKIDYIDRDILDTKEVGRLIALGIENVSGPWICLICGTPSKALRFGSYYYFRRHLVEVHNEKPATKICEYCGIKTPKRNLLVHHLLTKHGVEPPMQYNFPKCDVCNYVALTEASLTKHKNNHTIPQSFKCNVCIRKFESTNQLLAHIKQTGHKYTGERKADLKCIYCLRVFIREANLYSHIKANHKYDALRDGVIDDSDDEKAEIFIKKEVQTVKHETTYSSDYDEDTQSQDMQYIPQKLYKKNPTQKILNSGFPSRIYQNKTISKPETVQILNKQQSLIQEENTTSSVEDEDMVDIDGQEYYVHNNQLVKYIGNTNRTKDKEEYILSDMSNSQEYIIQQHNINEQQQYIEQLPTLEKLPNSIQPVQILVSNNEDYDTVMSSNSTAIFDDNTNKTLTVLNTPDTTSLPHVDMEVQQVPNSLMIVPDNYPLNTTATDTTNDSNIMVVYTQPANINSSYQIITTGNGEQYVEASEAAQNIEALAIPANTNDDIILQQTNAQETIRTNSETVTESTISNEVVIENETLPEVVLPGQFATQTLGVVQDDVEMSQTFTQDDTDLLESQEDSNLNHQQIDHNAVEEEKTLQQIEHEESVIHQNDEKEDNDQSHEMNNTHTGSVMEVFENDLIIAAQPNENDITENGSITTQTDVALEQYVEKVDEKQTKVVVPAVVQEKIQTLTSEWSEDDSDAIEQEIGAVIITDPQNNDASTENMTEPEEELEESIENIQKVMNNHSMKKDAVLSTTKDDVLEDSVSSTNNTVEETEVTIKDDEKHPQGKISSLLNDWEDNDSQEEEANGEENEKSEKCGESEEIQEEIVTEHCETPKDDKIKSLVSDWDDEEEEQKE